MKWTQRKKIHSHISSNHPTKLIYFFATNPRTSEREHIMSSNNVAYTLCLPVPEKAQKQYNYVFLPTPESELEAMLFILTAGLIKGDVDAGIESTG